MACNIKEVQSHNEGKRGRSVTGVYGSVMEVQNQSVPEGRKKMSGQGSIKGAWLPGLLKCTVCILGMKT